jgi:hypothetical protein
MNKEKLKENCCTPEGQIKRYIDCKGCDRKPKQKTLEESAKKYTRNTDFGTSNDYNAFIEGAKWQQERMYSEEEVLEIIKEVRKGSMINSSIGNRTYWEFDIKSEKKWFEQVKQEIQAL